ncbi:hypothetical Protein YC6258_02108 [Gynuella sunshinyii YC6258]|uniref:Uncharacterized protein n=1 Tax=Gynuella sunshinyii YC6258 TaxID=1445510 RepID=A0A0C5V3T2_9GAMM|nr:hypothetical Protein YC6258_02108 [Gynuella sunshinyii YC6258]
MKVPVFVQQQAYNIGIRMNRNRTMSFWLRLSRAIKDQT